MPLDPTTADKLIKLLGMLGSDHPGEVANAGTAAHRLMKTAGLTWADVIPIPPESAQKAWREPADWRDAVAICLGMPNAPLSSWDSAFLAAIYRQRMISERQQRVSTLLGLQNTVEPYLRWEYAFSGIPQGLHKRLTVSHGPERGL